MKDAIGGTWLMGIVLVFVVLFSSFLAFAVNYSKAFKVKNEIINIIEKNEGYTTSNNFGDKDISTQKKILTYLDSIGYNTTQTDIECPSEYNDLNGNKTKPQTGNYCVKEITEEYNPSLSANDKLKTYYKVTSFVIVEFPFLSGSFKIPISGETKRIYNNCSDSACNNK